MNAVVDAPRTDAGREQPPLVAELEHLRVLLESFRDGVPAPPAPEAEHAFEPALERLARVLGLSPFERGLVLLAAAPELDGETAALLSSLQGSADPRPTFGLALAALPGAHWDALAPASPLRRWRLVEPGSGSPLAARPLVVDERILHFLTGSEGLDPRLDGIVGVAAGPVALAPSQARLARELARTGAAVGSPVLLALDGEDVDAGLGVARELAAVFGLVPLVVRATALPPPGPELAAVACLLDREALLVGGIPIVAVEERGHTAVRALAETLAAPLVVVAGEQPGRVAGRVALGHSIPLPSPAEAREWWRTALGEPLARELSSTVEEVAQHFRLGAATIGAAARELEALDADEPAAALRRLCRERSRVDLDGLAERIEPLAGWGDLVLPEGHLELLRHLRAHVRQRTQVYERWGFAERTTRGLGVTALFAGESGTGKTLAAEVLARDLGLDLYRIDLAATVSKYIGETEKNLRRVFDAAEASGAVLLFDEADALFGKRGEVRDAHDRYANLEVAYLLQRMESYRGLAILTTNLRSNVDRAFLRRLRFVVQFPFPDAAQRAEIWLRTLPAALPLEGIQVAALARLNVPGGAIRSIALHAAFAAAEEGTPLRPEHVLRAARVEYAKAERALTEAETAGLR